MSRLQFLRQETIGSKTYSVINSRLELIGVIRKERTGRFIHWCFVFPSSLIDDLHDKQRYIFLSPGCQDEIREFCKELNGRKKDE